MGNRGAILFFVDMSCSLGDIYSSAIKELLKTVFEEEYDDILSNVWYSEGASGIPEWQVEHPVSMTELVGIVPPVVTANPLGSIPDYDAIFRDISEQIRSNSLIPERTILLFFTDGMFKELYPEEIGELLTGTPLEKCRRIVMVMGNREDRLCVLKLASSYNDVLNEDSNLLAYLSNAIRGW